MPILRETNKRLIDPVNFLAAIANMQAYIKKAGANASQQELLLHLRKINATIMEQGEVVTSTATPPPAANDERGPLERVYDDQIYALMQQVLHIANEAGMCSALQFQLDAPDGEPDNPLLVASCTAPTKARGDQRKMIQLVQPQKEWAFDLTYARDPKTGRERLLDVKKIF